MALVPVLDPGVDQDVSVVYWVGMDLEVDLGVDPLVRLFLIVSYTARVGGVVRIPDLPIQMTLLKSYRPEILRSQLMIVTRVVQSEPVGASFESKVGIL